MQSFTIVKLKANPNTVLDEVRSGAVEITHKNRPTMVLVLKAHYEHLQDRAEKNEG